MDLSNWIRSIFGFFVVSEAEMKHRKEVSTNPALKVERITTNSMVFDSGNLRNEKGEAMFTLKQPEDFMPQSKKVSKVFKKVNVAVYKMLNKMDNRKSFKDFFGIKLRRFFVSEKPNLTSTTSNPLEEVNATEFSYAGCLPLLTCVELPFEANLRTFYYPKCILLERCSGCCYGPYLSCQPTSVEDVKVKVTKISAAENGESSNHEDLTVTLQRHTACDCDCEVQERHCNSTIQRYDENECSCPCKNSVDEVLCSRRGNTHRWDPNECFCRCKYYHECTTGHLFNHDQCICEISSDSRPISSLHSTRNRQEGNFYQTIH